MNYRKSFILKFFFLAAALGLAMFLAFGAGNTDISSDHKVVFVLDINRTMNTKDVLSGATQISRIQAAKHLIHTTLLSDPGFSYGLIIFNHASDYIIPPTFDTGTFLLYLSGITTNLLPAGIKDLSSLSGLLEEKNASYIIFSDFTGITGSLFHYPRGTSLIGLGLSGYIDGVSYISDIASFSPRKVLYRGFALPLSQRISLYTLLGVLVILAIML